jgi:hypothetical protein
MATDDTDSAARLQNEVAKKFGIPKAGSEHKGVPADTVVWPMPRKPPSGKPADALRGNPGKAAGKASKPRSVVRWSSGKGHSRKSPFADAGWY